MAGKNIARVGQRKARIILEANGLRGASDLSRLGPDTDIFPASKYVSKHRICAGFDLDKAARDTIELLIIKEFQFVVSGIGIELPGSLESFSFPIAQHTMRTSDAGFNLNSLSM